MSGTSDRTLALSWIYLNVFKSLSRSQFSRCDGGHLDVPYFAIITFLPRRPRKDDGVAPNNTSLILGWLALHIAISLIFSFSFISSVIVHESQMPWLLAWGMKMGESPGGLGFSWFLISHTHFEDIHSDMHTFLSTYTAGFSWFDGLCGVAMAFAAFVLYAGTSGGNGSRLLVTEQREAWPAATRKRRPACKY